MKRRGDTPLAVREPGSDRDADLVALVRERIAAHYYDDMRVVDRVARAFLLLAVQFM